jgi:hypothetical protein
MAKSVSSIDSSIHGTGDDEEDEEYALAQQEWEESLKQLSQIVSAVFLPYLGKWFGRRYAYIGMCFA